MKKLTIATRKSQLALWQAEFVKAELEKAHTDLRVEFLAMSTRGDKILDSPLAKIGGKGLFVKELEHAILAGEADIAVHSMKDVPMFFPEGLCLGPICVREDPRDAFISNSFDLIDELPEGAVVGTSSLRRQCQLQKARPDLVIKSLRGNVNTRLAKLDAGEFDAIILAAAGMIRLNMPDRIKSLLAPELSLPACGQGAIGIELRSDDTETAALIEVLNHPPTASRVSAERAMNTRLNGGCQVPIAGFAELDGNKTVWQEISDEQDMLRIGNYEVSSRAYCGRFNFKGEGQQKYVKDLSGGERNRLHLAKLLKQGANVLLLDEPTNDLDVETLRALEDAILAFPGCAIVISHDRWFLDRIATHILGYEDDGSVIFHEGNLSDYESDRIDRMGDAALIPTRIKYQKIS